MPAWEKQSMAEGSTSGNSSSSKSLMWMMVALFAGLGLLLAAGFFIASQVMRSMGVRTASVRDTVRTPEGSFRVEKDPVSGPGLPVYPRASLMIPGESSAALKEAQSGMETSTYHTTDSREFVDDWYSKHLSPDFTRHDAGEKALPDILRDAGVSQEDVAFAAERNQKVRIVALSLDSGGTKISLIRYDKKEPGPAPAAEPASAAAPTSTPQ